MLSHCIVGTCEDKETHLSVPILLCIIYHFNLNSPLCVICDFSQMCILPKQYQQSFGMNDSITQSTFYQGTLSKHCNVFLFIPNLLPFLTLSQYFAACKTHYVFPTLPHTVFQVFFLKHPRWQISHQALSLWSAYTFTSQDTCIGKECGVI